MIKRYRPLSEHHEGMIYMAEDKDGPWVHYADYTFVEARMDAAYQAGYTDGFVESGLDPMTWVSVDERLPDDGQEVLLWIPSARPCAAYHDKVYGWCFGAEVEMFGKPTHWMEIKPPSEDE